MSEFSRMPDMDDPTPVNDFEVGFGADDLMERHLYNIYADQVFESMEDFAGRMHERFGDNWRNILSRK